jgi:hypothetical protein
MEIRQSSESQHEDCWQWLSTCQWVAMKKYMENKPDLQAVKSMEIRRLTLRFQEVKSMEKISYTKITGGKIHGEDQLH